MTGRPADVVERSVTLRPGEAVDSLRERMRVAEVDAYLSLDPDNQTYLTGFRAQIYSRPLILMVTATNSVLIVPELEEQHARPLAQVDEVLVYCERPGGSAPTSHMPLLESTLDRLPGGARVAIDAQRLAFAYAEAVRHSGRETVAFDEVLRLMRSVKRADELAAMRIAGELSQAGLSASIDAAAVGVSELRSTRPAMP